MSLTVVVHGALEDQHHALFHFLWRKAGIAPHNADHRNVDVGKISTGMVMMRIRRGMAIRIDITTNVYGV